MCLLVGPDFRDIDDEFSFLTGYLPDRRDHLPLAYFISGKNVTNYLYILAPCKVFLYTKSSIALTLSIINHYFTDKL